MGVAAHPPALDPPPEPDIVVAGERRSLRDRIIAFVSSVTPQTASAQVARWDRRLCLNVEGASPQQHAFFAASIAAAGRELGLAVVRDSGCEPAAHIVFSPDPNLLLDRIDETRPGFFGAIPPADRNVLRSSDAAVRWLSFAQLRGGAGETPTGFSIDIGKGGVERTGPAVRAIPSRLQTGARMDLQSMIVLVDSSRLEGISNRSLAAFLAMVVLGNVRPDHQAPGATSILGLFRSDRPAGLATEGLSPWDRAYLRSLYAGAWNVAGDRRMRQIGASMEREVSAAADRPSD